MDTREFSVRRRPCQRTGQCVRTCQVQHHQREHARSFQANRESVCILLQSRGKEFGKRLAERMLAQWPDPEDWDRLDYDRVSYLVYDVIVEFCRQGPPDFKEWLRPDCEIGEALLDHVTARSRDGLRLFADSPGEAFELLANTIEFATKKIIR